MRGIPVVGWLIYIAILFTIIVLEVNTCGAFIKIFRGEKTGVDEPFTQLKVNFFRKGGGMLWMSLWVCLWSLLFIVPGIIKALSYSMAPFILADRPNVTATGALKLSMRMTKGHKGKLFVLALSWIGWMILSALTLDILYIVYVGPYMSATYAGFYEELRDQAVASGAIGQFELD